MDSARGVIRSFRSPTADGPEVFTIIARSRRAALLDGRTSAAYRIGVRVLAIDTSSEVTTVACSVDGNLQFELTRRAPARHGDQLITHIAEVLDGSGVAKEALELIAVGIGPGSFTGTRVGLATAKGLGLALGCPVVGVGTLRAIAAAAAAPRVATLVDAQKGEVFIAVFVRDEHGLRSVRGPAHLAPEQAAAELAAIGPCARCGSGLRRYPEAFAELPGETLSAVFDAPRAAVVADEGFQRFRAHGADTLALLEPLYVRPSDAKRPQADS